MFLVPMMAIVRLMALALVLASGEIPLWPNKMFPDGFDYDFGTVLSGTRVEHAFRIVNTSKVPLRIVSLRLS